MLKLRIASAAVLGVAGLGATALPAQAAAPTTAPTSQSTQAAATQAAATQAAVAQGVSTRVRAVKGVTCIDLFGAGKLVATGCFQSNGDDIGVRDQRKDGLRAVVTWKTNYGRSGKCQETRGGGKSTICNYNMKKGKKVRFKVDVRNGANGNPKFSSPYSPWLSIGK
ncbi:hypothetical protein ACFYVL_32270 [Streptomyces sp. NPDC004111]|uniref:hypothetical protein n=1 Tax=Streptomyces sp. NPDC004111 TaxID=3364690 RepID=UPI0036CCAF67